MVERLQKLFFTKMHGLGNDFVVVDGRQIPPGVDLNQLAAFLCDRHFGIGADGLIIAGQSDQPDVFDIRFDFFNSDGTTAQMCGNGIRCFARYVLDNGLLKGSADTRSFTVQTLAGPIKPTVNPDNSVTVDMGPPIFDPARIPFDDVTLHPPVKNYGLEVFNRHIPVTLVSMGNPHCIIFQQDLDAPLDPAVFGPAIETHPAFPEKTNVEFVEVRSRTHLKVIVWERGCGFTLACGTGACASAVAAMLHDKADSTVQVELPGGPMTIAWPQTQGASVMMSGPASYVYDGQIALPESVFVGNPAPV